ncbi:hypothetical protein SCLCIDRAFT_1213283 [Scleroderma citrinum Foug A]|uniref:Uncharacterized protein n=1 Tax=Scleroderma citrinum Foug A TaxID=1036808 RepID=A0A0C3DV22_9AGAM|nr:hypothetical protein SCLCIDRAFT_1213283 [Scleroderma citrinum Foug A]
MSASKVHVSSWKSGSTEERMTINQNDQDPRNNMAASSTTTRSTFPKAILGSSTQNLRPRSI